jgi:hypothetical protein
MPDDQRTIPITRGRPHLVVRGSVPSPPIPLVDRRFEDRRKPSPPIPLVNVVWPLAVGLSIGFLAPEALQLANSLGYWGARLAFPLAELAARPEFGYSAKVANVLSTIFLYLQFPLEGVLVMLNLRRNIALRPTVNRLALLHLAGAALLWLLERPHSR